MRMFVFVCLMLSLGLSSVSAQSIDPRCSKMRDKLGCTCALQNGGWLSADGQNWYTKRNVSSPVNEAFVQCQIRNGRK